MVKKRFLIAFLLSFALLFATLAGCDMSTTNPTSSSESESVLDTESLTDSQGDSYFESEESDVGDSEENLSESEESVSESDSSAAVTVPTFNFSLTSTETSITIVEEENDPSDVGEITAIEFSLGNDKINVEDLSQREFNGLYSGEQYTVKITYTYNIGDGDVSDTYTKRKYTVAMRVPSVSATYTAESETSISFELEIDDKSNNMTITAIKLIPQDGGEEISLDDLTSRIFEDIPTGQYELVVCYDYDLNKGEGLNSAEYRLSVATVISPLSIPDFTVEVEEGRNPVILQLSDTQIIDAMQARSGRAVDKTYYAPERMEDRLFKFLRETITSTNPDLILITGDLVYGEFDYVGTSLLALIEAMDSFQIPWAPVFGNHDNESKMGADWQCEQLENSEYCLFKQRTLTGNGNYTVGIVQGDKLTRVFFMMDSNGCGAVSAESLANGHTTSSVGFGNDQIAWFEEVGARINELSPDTKISFAFHINISMFKNAYKKYGFTNSGTKDNPINIDLHPDKEDGDFGYLGADLKGPWDLNFVVYRKMVAIGCDSIYIGHEHLNSASVVYEGVRFQFSQKISTYDRCNWLTPDGEVVGSYPPFSGGKEIMGGTVNVLDETGAIVDAYIYYCDGVDPTR